MDNRIDEELEAYNTALFEIVYSKDPLSDYRQFLKQASKHYSKTFKEQVMIANQAPTATAVLSRSEWERLYGRSVIPGAVGIMLEDREEEEEGKKFFDVSETRESKNSRPVTFWSGSRLYDEPVLKALSDAYSVTLANNSFDEDLKGISNVLAAELVENARRRIEADLNKPGKNRTDFDEVIEEARRIIADGIYTMMTVRYGVPTEDIFQGLTYFEELSESFISIEAIGEAVATGAAKAIQIMAKEIRRLEDKHLLSESREVKDDRETTTGQVGRDTRSLSEGIQAGLLPGTSGEQEAGRTSGRNRGEDKHSPQPDDQTENSTARQERAWQSDDVYGESGSDKQYRSERERILDPGRNIGIDSLAEAFPEGTSVYIGQTEYEVFEYEKDYVVLVDQKAPLFLERLSLEDFITKIKENPLNVIKEDWNKADDELSVSADTVQLDKPLENLHEVTKEDAINVQINYRITDDNLGQGGAKTRARWNLDAINKVKELEKENRLAIQDEQETLARYVGFGSIPQIFDADNSSWKTEYEELKSLLNDEEYKSARASTLNAHYTSPLIIRAMYKALANLGFKSGNILEPSCGIGHFFGLVPDDFAETKLYGVEIDPLTASIAKQLYQNADIKAEAFERSEYSDNFFDVAIGNVPFGNYGVSDSRYNKERFLIHDYFFAKTIDKVRPGGLIALITSKGTLDKADDNVRRYIEKRADLLGAIRLPSMAFKANAGTEVPADIIFLQKKITPSQSEIDPDWLSREYGLNEPAYNRYFKNNPDMMIGEMVFSKSMYGNDLETSCELKDESTFEKRLNSAIEKITGSITQEIRVESGQDLIAEAIPALPGVANHSYAIHDKKIYYRVDSSMVKQELSEEENDRVTGLVSIRKAREAALLAQRQGKSDEEINEALVKLNLLYDVFVFGYGFINDKKNEKAFRKDSTKYLLSSLEKYDDSTGEYVKTEIFTKRVIRPYQAPTFANTPLEALTVSLSEKGRADIEYMAQLTGMEKEEVIDGLDGVIFRLPGNAEEYQTAEEYLSGNVREKLVLAASAYEKDEAYEKNVKALEAVIPKDLDAGEISVTLGSVWIPANDYKEFIAELLDSPYYVINNLEINYSKLLGRWDMKSAGMPKTSVAVSSTYGTSRINAYDIILSTLNLSPVTVYDLINDSGKERRVINRIETAIARSKQDIIKEEFKEWIFSEQNRRERLVEYYNENFNAITPRNYDGSYLELPGMNPDIALRAHQKNAVARVLHGGNTLLAHTVGAGKTFVIITAAHELRRVGLAHRSMIIVPNHLVEQWAAEYNKLYPEAKILVALKKDMTADRRKEFTARITTGDYEAVIMAQSSFEKIAMSEEFQIKLIEAEIEKAAKYISEAQWDFSGKKISIKRIEQYKKRMEVSLDNLVKRERKDDLLSFEQLGIDHLFVDESQNYKNLSVNTKMQNVAGVSQAGSQRAWDLYMKCRYMDERTGSKGITFATGTPITNTMCELYTLHRYLQSDELERMDLSHFDAWAAMFGETISTIELAPEGTGFRQKTRFAKFNNLPELMTLFRQSADIQTADMLDLPVPAVVVKNITVAPSDFQVEIVKTLGSRAEKVRNREVEPTVDNMLKITTDGRRLALDQRLIDPNLPDDPNSKVSTVCANVAQIYHQTVEIRGTQLVFCDQSTPKTDGSFSIYDDMKRKLVELGVKADEIEFMQSAKTEAQKDSLFAKVNSGRVRVLIGSTETMGAGTNVQERLVVTHDADCPWRPADLEQRMGRIARQGNMNKEVQVYRYVTEGTFDAYLYQLLESKQTFISQIMTSKTPQRSSEDIDETTLTYAEVKALATGDPSIKEKMELEIEVAKLKILKSNYLAERYRLETSVSKTLPARITEANERLSSYKRDLELTLKSKDALFEITVGSTTYKDRAAAGAALMAVFKQQKSPLYLSVGKYRGFEISVGYNAEAKSPKIRLEGAMNYGIDASDSDIGNIRRIENAVEAINEKVKDEEQRIEEVKAQIKDSKRELEKPFTQEAEFESKMARLSIINTEMELGKDDLTEQTIAKEMEILEGTVVTIRSEAGEINKRKSSNREKVTATSSYARTARRRV